MSNFFDNVRNEPSRELSISDKIIKKEMSTEFPSASNNFRRETQEPSPEPDFDERTLFIFFLRQDRLEFYAYSFERIDTDRCVHKNIFKVPQRQPSPNLKQQEKREKSNGAQST